jgi:hypothetical protein
MPFPHWKFKTGFVPLLVLSAAALQGCSKSPPNLSQLSSPLSSSPVAGGSDGTGTTTSGGVTTPPPVDRAQVVADQVQQSVAAPLNQSPQYALTSDDLAVLQSQGVLADGDGATLTPLLKQ